MIKALLLATTLAFAPMAVMAQDAPTGAPPAPEATAKAPPLQMVFAKICMLPTTAKLGENLAKDFALGLMWDTPISDDTFIRNTVYVSKEESEGSKEVIELATFFKGNVIVNQCVSSLGGFDTAVVEKMKKSWAEHPTAGTQEIPAPPADPTPAAPNAIPVPAPKFQDDQSSDD